MCKGEAEVEEVRSVKAFKKAGMMQMKDKSGNIGSLEYNKFQSFCTKPSTRGERRGESKRREEEKKGGREVNQVITRIETAAPL